MPLDSLLTAHGPEVDDPEEESFLLFSQSIPSQNLGFVDARAARLDITIADRDLSIVQSPTILSSNRGGGTTGAVVWKITPLFASWLAAPSNVLFAHDVLSSSSAVLELGCGISGITALSVAPRVGTYVLTDQDYVMKLLHENLRENQAVSGGCVLSSSSAFKGRKSAARPQKKGPATPGRESNIVTCALDWETDEVASSLSSPSYRSFDAVVACDCIYNDALIEPLVQTCVDACRLRAAEAEASAAGDGEAPVRDPTVCIVAQQLRSAEVFEAWLKSFSRSFRVWRVPDEELIEGLRTDSGFVVHIGILK